MHDRDGVFNISHCWDNLEHSYSEGLIESLAFRFSSHQFERAPRVRSTSWPSASLALTTGDLTTELVISPHNWWSHHTADDFTTQLVISPHNWWSHHTTGDLTTQLVISPHNWWSHHTTGDLTQLVISPHSWWYHCYSRRSHPALLLVLCGWRLAKSPI